MNNRYDMEAFRAQLKSVRYILEPRTVSNEVKEKLPKDFRIMAFHTSQDMDNQDYEAMMVRFQDPSGIRIANFRLDDGRYMDDFFL